MTKQEKIYQTIADMNDEELIELYNEYAQRNHYEPIFLIEQLDEIYQPKCASEALECLELVNKADSYLVWCLDYLQSFNSLSDEFSYQELADYVWQNETPLGNNSLSEILFGAYTLWDCVGCMDDDEKVDIDGVVKTAKEWDDDPTLENKWNLLVDYYIENETTIVEFL